MRRLWIFALALGLAASPALAWAQADRTCYDLAIVGTIEDAANETGVRPSAGVFAPTRLDLVIHVRHAFTEDDVGDQIRVRGAIMTSLPGRDVPLLFLLKRWSGGYESVGWDFAHRNWLWLGRFKPPEEYGAEARFPPRCS